MATKSTAKRKSAPVPLPVKSPKTRLTKSMRDTLHRFMVDEFRKRLDKTEIDKTLAALVGRTNITG
jgi:excinuclease UvrABC nuclease subunit